jgi:hypothetical protein
VETFSFFISACTHLTSREAIVIRLIEKMSHLALSIALSDVIGPNQKQEVSIPTGCTDFYI